MEPHPEHFGLAVVSDSSAPNQEKKSSVMLQSVTEVAYMLTLQVNCHPVNLEMQAEM